MLKYTAIVTWMTVKRNGGYTQKSKVIKNILSTDICRASEIALKTISGEITPGVSCIWNNFPQ